MSKQSKQHDQLKLDAVRYVKEHPNLMRLECAESLGNGLRTISCWLFQYYNSERGIPSVGSGHYPSEKMKEIAHLKRELRIPQEAPDVLKKLSAFRENNGKICIH